MRNISFEKATLPHKDLIFAWLEKPHVQEFWDNSSEHREDILLFRPAASSHRLDEHNPRANHVYEKAGFQTVGEYTSQEGYFTGNKSAIMIKKLP